MSEEELKPVPSEGWAAMIRRGGDQAGRSLSRPSLLLLPQLTLSVFLVILLPTYLRN